VSITTPETFLLLPEVPANAPCTSESLTEERHAPLSPIPCSLAGPGSIADVMGAGSVASSELSVEQQQKVEEHAVRALTYEHVFSQISLLAKTQVVDYRYFNTPSMEVLCVYKSMVF